MAVPKRKTSTSKRNMRRAHDALRAVHSGNCDNCGTPKLTHHMCDSCGFFNGRQVL